MNMFVNSKSKFKPCTTHRYLPGEVPKNCNDTDLKLYNKHRLRVFMAKPLVDTKPYKLDVTKWIDRKKLREDLLYAISVDKQNKELLKRINLINRKGGYVDTYNPIAYRRTDKWKTQEKKMKIIECHNKEIYRSIVNSVSHYETKQFDHEWKMRTLPNLNHSSRFPFMILKKISMDTILHSQPSISNVPNAGNIVRPLCFLEFKVRNGEFLGRVIIELYYDYVPVTVQNFLSLCNGEGGLTYKNCSVHRIIKNQYLETGDITHGNGRGGYSVYGKNFQEENHVLKHSKAGVLSMKRIPPTDNNSQFCITFRKMEGFDYKNVVFGKIIKGNDNLFNIQDYGRRIGKPYAEIIISNCGEIKTETPEFCDDNEEIGKLSNDVGTVTMKGCGIGNAEVKVKKCKCLPSCR